MSMIEILNSSAPSYSGYLAMPTGEDIKVPGIITIQHVFGVSREMQSLTSNFAENGYIALCPDLYWRIEAGAALEPTGPDAIQKAVAYALKLDTDQAIEDLKAAIEFLRSHPRCNGKVGTVGYCLGGFFAFLLAARAQENSDCNVGYFGVHIEKYLEEATHLSPLMLHIPEKDRYVPPDVQALIRQ